MSNVGRPDRQLYYDIHDPVDSEPLSASTLTKFLFGDILEQLLLFLAKEAGHTVEAEQAEVVVNGVVGHIDAIIDGVVVDCKSASSIAFKKFNRHEVPDDDPFGYMEQLAGYSEGTGGRDAAFLAIDKTLGHIALDPHDAGTLKSYNVPQRIDHLRDVLSGSEIPERCYDPVPEGKSGNMRLDTGCSYCSHKFKCWADANNGIGLRTFLYARGPVHLVEVVEEPRVYESTF